MSTSLLKIIADFETQLNAPVSVGATTATLYTATDDDAVALPTGVYGLTIDLGNSKKEYIICTLTGTALTNIQSISRQGALTTGFVRTHRRGAKVVITDWAILKRMLDNLTGTTGFDSATNLGYDGAPTGLTGNQFATVNYVLSVVNGGTVSFDQQVISNQVLGETISVNDVVYFKESDQRWWKADADLTATFDQIQLGVSKTTGVAGGSATIAISGPVSGFSGLLAGSKYYLSNTAGAISDTAGTYSVFVGWALSATSLLFSTFYKTLPTQNEKDALVGSVGSPSSTNTYVTQNNLSTGATDQSQTTVDTTVEVGEADATTKKNKYAQSFLPLKNKIRGVNLYKSADTGTFTGTVTVSLQADTAGSPSGTPLATVTISNIEYINMAIGEFEALFTTEYASMTVDNATLYWIVIQTSTSDNSNHPNLGANTAGGYNRGTSKYNNTANGWLPNTPVDLYFKTLEGIAGQALVLPSTAKIPDNLYDRSEMPTLVYEQSIALGTSLSVQVGFTATQNGSVFYRASQATNTITIARYERNIAGKYLLTHSVAGPTNVATASGCGLVVVGDYLYVNYQVTSTNVYACRRMLGSDLTGGTAMTVPVLTGSGNVALDAWIDGIYFYVAFHNSTSVSRLSLSGTTLTLVDAGTRSASITNSTPSFLSTFFDGKNTYMVTEVSNDVYIYKVLTVFANTVSTTTYTMSNLSCGNSADINTPCGIPVDTQIMYILLEAMQDETGDANEYYALFFTPIAKP